MRANTGVIWKIALVFAVVLFCVPVRHAQNMDMRNGDVVTSWSLFGINIFDVGRRAMLPLKPNPSDSVYDRFLCLSSMTGVGLGYLFARHDDYTAGSVVMDYYTKFVYENKWNAEIDTEARQRLEACYRIQNSRR